MRLLLTHLVLYFKEVFTRFNNNLIDIQNGSRLLGQTVLNDIPHEINFNSYKMGQTSWTCSISYKWKGELPSYDQYTVCPRSNDPFYIASLYIKWVTTSRTYSILFISDY